MSLEKSCGILLVVTIRGSPKCVHKEIYTIRCSLDILYFSDNFFCEPFIINYFSEKFLDTGSYLAATTVLSSKVT